MDKWHQGKKTKATLALAALVGVLWGLGWIDGAQAEPMLTLLGFTAVGTMAAKVTRTAAARVAVVCMLGLGVSAAPASAAPQLDLLGLFNLGFDEISIGNPEWGAGLGIRRKPGTLITIDAEPTGIDLLKPLCKTPWVKDRVTFLCAGDELAGL
ncbi:MAG: hypothetical protein V3W41_14520 [Planctomycetota bacterium]